MLFDELGVIGYSPPQLVPAKKMDAEQTLCLVALGYGVNMRLKLGIVRGRGCNRKFRQRRRELERFSDLIIDVLRRQFDRPAIDVFFLHCTPAIPPAGRCPRISTPFCRWPMRP